MTTNKTICKIQQSFTFFLWQFIKAVVVTFVVIVFVFFVDKFFITITILSHLITEVSAALFDYLLLSQIDVLGFKL